MNSVDQFFANIVIGINSIIHNYGVTMILFTLLIKVIVLPLDFKSRKGMRKMTQVQPQLAKLQKKYANDKEKLNQKTAELYKKEGVSPMSGCLPMLVSMVILYIMWAGMRLVANQEIAKQALTMIANGTTEYNFEGFLWIKNIWMPDSPFHPIVAMQSDLQMIPANVWASVSATLTDAQRTAVETAGVQLAGTDLAAITSSVFNALNAIPGYTELLNDKTTVWNLLAQIEVFGSYNGFFILPILSAVSQYVMTVTQPQQPTNPDNPQAGTGNFMKYFFPLFSLWICSSFNAMFALYWVVSNLYAWIQTLALNKYFEVKEKQEAQHKMEEDGLK